MFQSLFLWIFRSYDVTNTKLEKAKEVSILVLMDFPFLQEGEVAMIREYVEVSILVLMDFPFLLNSMKELKQYWKQFQSLFLWIFRSY